MPEAGYQIEFI